ncbi:MAG: ABC transporter substrate-binding protein [Cryobacterium sp.]|nr:ABC transporter substrate-binding protein [Cryobacterium sp.]
MFSSSQQGTRRSTRFGRALLTVAVSSALVLTGCTAADPGETPSADPGGPIASFTYGIPTPPSSLDLTKNMNGWTAAVTVLVTEPLERFDSSGAVTPVLATSVATPDETTVVYTLREGVTFSDGSELTADDVVAAFNRAIDAASGAQTASILTSIGSVEASGDLEVTVNLSHPDPAIRGSVAFGVQVAKASAVTDAGADFGTAAGLPIGTGPYTYATFGASNVDLVPNPGYWGDAPRIQKLAFTGFDTDNTAQLAMRSGSLQANYVNTPKSTSQWAALPGASVFSTPSLLSTFLTFDTTRAPFDDVHARLAISHLVDRVALNTVAYGDEAQVMRVMAPDAEFLPLAGSQQALDAFLASVPQYDFDVEAAKRELALSATPGGFALEVPYPTSEPFAEPVLLALQQAAAPLGITITLKPQTFIEWATDVYMFNIPQLGMFQIGDLQPDPNGGMALMVGAANAAPTKFNMSVWTPADLEPAILAMTQSSDSAERWEASKQIMLRAAEEMPYVPLFAPNTVLVYADGYGSTTDPDFMSFITGAWLTDLVAEGSN